MHARRAANPEAYIATSRRHFERNREKKLAALTAWGKANPDRLRDAKRRHMEANRDLYAAYAAWWRRAARDATPPWADFDAIRTIYTKAQEATRATGIDHAVDHIVPLQGKLVCGLHVQANLRVIPATENSKKRNKLDHALVEALMRADIALL